MAKRGRPNRSGINWSDPAAINAYNRAWKRNNRDPVKHREQMREVMRKRYEPSKRSPEEIAQHMSEVSQSNARQRREKRSDVKLTPDLVREIRHRADSGETQTVLAADYGVSGSTISLIVNRKIWKDID